MSPATSVPQAGRPGPGADAWDSALLDALLSRDPIGFAFIDSTMSLRRVNRSLADMIGVDPASQPGRTPAQAWPAALAARTEAAVRRVIASGRPVADDGNGAETSAGQDSQLALSWYPAQDPDGVVTGVTMIAIDVSGRVDAAQALRRSQERYRSLVQAGAQVVWITTPTGAVIEDSPEWRWITGQSVHEYLAAGWLAAVHPDDRPKVEQDWLECIRTGTVFDGRYRVRTKTGSFRHYDVRAVPIERDGAIIEWMGANTDVTAQREAEEMRGRLTEQLSAAALRTSRLQQATSLLAEALSVREVVAVITEVGRSAIGADRSALALVDEDRLRLRIISPGGGTEQAGQPAEEIPMDEPGVMSSAIALRRSVILDSPESRRQHLEQEAETELFLPETDEQAWVGLPLTTSGLPLGALQFSFTRNREITDDERVFLEALAGQCALALERAQLFEREHETAASLQRSLLPDSLPEVPGMSLRPFYKPLSIEVGGDWYDAFRLPDGKLAVAVGDVMGKGLTAAAGMGRVRNALRALALTDPRPAAVLAGLDRLFIATESAEQVTTVCYLVVDPRTGEGVAGNAGHLPPLLLRSGTPPWLDGAEAGTPLGWASPRQQYPFSLAPGMTAVLYSDGLVENRKRGLDVGLDELVAVAGQAPPEVVADPARLIDYLVDRMLAGYQQDDDVTVLVLRMPGPPAARPGAGPARGSSARER